MGRRPCMCLAQLKHVLLFRPVAFAACCRAGEHYQGWGGAGGNEAVRVVPRRAGWVLLRRGKWVRSGRWVLPKRSAVNDSSVTCPEDLFAKVTGNDHSVRVIELI